jgi:hypothetical protein
MVASVVIDWRAKNGAVDPYRQFFPGPQFSVAARTHATEQSLSLPPQNGKKPIFTMEKNVHPVKAVPSK